MAKPNELLATSLAALRGVTHNGSRSVVKSEELSRVHRESVGAGISKYAEFGL